MAELRATPMVNPVMGLLADRLKKVQQFGAKPFGYENPPVEMLMNLLGVPAVQQTMERMAYGEPLTTGRGMTTKPRAEAVEAAMTVAPVAGLLGKATKGLPVGASIESVGKFNVAKRDASEIFGEGAQRVKYTDPKSGGSIDVLARPDGTASVLELQVPEKFRGKGIGESLQKQVLQDFPDMQGQVSSKAAATTAYRLGRRPVDMPNATLKDVHKMIDEDSSVNLISPKMQERISPSASYPQQEALDLAQQRAALPKEQYGLGLPADNTPEMRAAAMNMEKRGFHETEGKNIEQGLLDFDTRRVGAAASDEQTPYAMFIKPHGSSIGIAKDQPAQMPLYVKSNLTDENVLQAFGDRAELQQYLNQFPDIRDATKAVRDLDNQMARYMDEMTKKSDDLYAQGKIEESDKLLNAMANDSPLMKQFDERLNELSAIAKEKITQHFQEQGIGTVGLTNDQGAFGRKTITEMVLNPAENVRSAFAAFDPWRRTAAIAAATGVAAPNLMAQEVDYSLLPEQKKKEILSLLE
jgi:predicted GNAT family acetyltransferase